MPEKVKQNDIIALVDTSLRKYILDTSGKTDKYKGIGVINPSTLVGKKYGEKVQIGNKEFRIFKPSIMDKIQGIQRHAQIILPKDSSQIILNCSITSGKKILEAGIGSGALTVALASQVAPDGQVISYDKRKDFIEHAEKNLKKVQLDQYVSTKHKDITKGIDEKNLDSVILDIPNPWKVVPHAWDSLKVGGYLCTYSPLTSQVEKTVKEIKKHSFIEVKTMENLQREMIVSEKGMRPSFKMLGHTGYLTYARKTL